MRDYRTVPPAFSTYAVGSPQSARVVISKRLIGRASTHPAIAVVVTASAMAIVFASGTEWLDVSSTGPDATGTASENRRASDAATGATPGFSLGSPASSASVERLRAGPEPTLLGKAKQPAGEEELPWLMVAQSTRVETSVGKGRVPHARTSAAAPETLSSSKVSGAVSSAGDCESSCAGVADSDMQGELELSSAEKLNGERGPAARRPSDVAMVRSLSEPIVGSRSSSPTGLGGNSIPENTLLADLQPAILLAPIGELIAATPAIAPPSAVHARVTSGRPDEAPLHPKDLDGQANSPSQPIGQEAIALMDPPPPAPMPAQQASSIDPPSGTDDIGGMPEQVERIEPTRSIAKHLERVGARYAQAPQGEDRIASDSLLGSASEQLTDASTGKSLPIALTDTSDAGRVVIHDDELVSIKLAELVSLFEDRLDRPLYVWMKESKSASKFVTVETLAAAGISAKYDPRSRQVVFSVTDN